MESTVYGHPGQPRPGGDPLRRLAHVTPANLGLTFEEDDLRARGVLLREVK